MSDVLEAPVSVDPIYVPLGVAAAFEAAPFARVRLRVRFEVTGPPGVRVRVGLAFDGATTHPPDEGDYAVWGTPDAPGESEVHVQPHPWQPNAPFWWPKDREWPGPVPVGHVAPGAHRVALWARTEGGTATVVAASVRVL